MITNYYYLWKLWKRTIEEELLKEWENDKWGIRVKVVWWSGKTKEKERKRRREKLFWVKKKKEKKNERKRKKKEVKINKGVEIPKIESIAPRKHYKLIFSFPFLHSKEIGK